MMSLLTKKAKDTDDAIETARKAMEETKAYEKLLLAEHKKMIERVGFDESIDHGIEAMMNMRS
jgi:hypothetical protein